MLDERAFAVVLMLISVALGYLGYAVGGVLPGVICLVVAAIIALALWTPLRAWLGIPPPPQRSRRRVGHRKQSASPENPFRRKAIEHLESYEQAVGLKRDSDDKEPKA